MIYACRNIETQSTRHFLPKCADVYLFEQTVTERDPLEIDAEPTEFRSLIEPLRVS